MKKILNLILGLIAIIAISHLFSHGMAHLWAVIPILGPAFNDLYKKWGREVFSHNHYQLYGRGYKVPSNKKTTFQSVQRQEVRKYSKLWKDPTVDQVAWNVWAANHPLTKKGRLIHLTGQVTFIQFNLIGQKAAVGVSLVTSPPSVESLFPIFTGMTLATTTGPDTVTVEPIKIGVYPTGIKMQLYASPMLSPGVFVQQKMKMIGVYDPTSSVAIDVTADYTNLFGSLILAKKIFFEARFIMPTGEADLFVKENSIIIPAP